MDKQFTVLDDPGIFGFKVVRIETEKELTEESHVQLRNLGTEFVWMINKKWTTWCMLYAECDDRRVFYVGDREAVSGIREAISSKSDNKDLRTLVGMMAAMKFMDDFSAAGFDDFSDAVVEVLSAEKIDWGRYQTLLSPFGKSKIFFDKEPDVAVIDAFVSRFGLHARPIGLAMMTFDFGGGRARAMKHAVEITATVDKYL